MPLRYFLTRNKGQVKIAPRDRSSWIPGDFSEFSAKASGARPLFPVAVPEVPTARSPATVRFRSAAPIEVSRVFETSFESLRL